MRNPVDWKVRKDAPETREGEGDGDGERRKAMAKGMLLRMGDEDDKEQE